MKCPTLRGVFKGDRVTVCARPEELRLATAPGPNRIRAEFKRAIERPQSIRLDFGDNLIVDVPRSSWDAEVKSWWIELPAESLRHVPNGRNL
jgi:hypothetical protein